jgi:Mitochondrial ribosomal protein (VAR1)
MNSNKSEKLVYPSKIINLETNKPIIFNKKVNNNNSKVIPLNTISNDTGQTRHFAPAAQEWYNSVYAYNNNYVKLLPIADKNLMILLQSYFNFYFGKNLLKIKRLATRYKRLSAKKIFVGKGDLKHTTNKVFITLYVHNTEKRFLIKEINKLFKSLFYPNLSLSKYINIDRNGNEIISYNRPFTLREYLKLSDHYTDYLSLITSLVNKLTNYLGIITEYYKTLSNLVDLKVLTESEKLLIFNKKLKDFPSFNYPSYDKYMNEVYSKYLKELWSFVYLFQLNKAKFDKTFLLELTRLVRNIYNKEVEFNIVNLKKMHLNSDIFTQAVALKLKNRDNKLYRVLRSSLSKVKLPNVNRINENYSNINKEELLVNKIRNNKINSMFINGITNKDSLNNLLLNIFPLAENLEIGIKNRLSTINRPISLTNFIFRSLKHINISGVRIEAKGRLTRRFTASRSVFKMKWKGGLKNVDASFRGLSTVILRGHVKSNLQYSMLHSKNRNGAFGVKGWVSNK